MAERLKKQIVEQDKSVDLVCGPDAYRDLPRMLALTEGGQAAGRTIYLETECRLFPPVTIFLDLFPRAGYFFNALY